MDENELRSRVEALERLNSTLLRIVRENANKARKQPRKASGYVFKVAEERWERAYLNPGGILCPEIKTSDPFKCWRVAYETPYALDMVPEDVRTAVLTDFSRFGLPAPLQEPIMLTSDEFTMQMRTEDNLIVRLSLRATGNSDFWEANIYSTKFALLHPSCVRE